MCKLNGSGTGQLGVNGDKCGVMHMRRKGVKRTKEKFYVGEEEIATVEEYKYLVWCIRV